jgi:hypothetical protein
METPYPLVELGDVALSFTYPSRVFLIETTMNSEIAFDLKKALEYLAAEHRAELTHEYGTRLHLIAETPLLLFDTTVFDVHLGRRHA